MSRFLAGALSALLLVSGGLLIWQGQAAEPPPLPPPPAAPVRPARPVDLTLPEPPEATPRTREEKRFSRADKDKNGRITLAELTQPRRKAFAKLDRNGDGRLSFEEWAVKTIDKFEDADANRDGALVASEYRTTAPKPRRKPACAC